MEPIRRHRQKGVPFLSRSTQKYYSLWNLTNSSENIDGSNAHHYTGEGTDMYDYVNPDFYRRVARGEIVMSPLTKRIYRIVDTPGVGNTRTRKTSHLVDGVPRFTVLRTEFWQGPTAYLIAKGSVVLHPIYIEPSQILPSKDVSDFIVEKTTELMNKRGRPDHDIWESVAEINKTVSLLPGLFKSMKRAVPLVNRSDLGRSMAEVWLAYRYGIKPLLADVEGVMKGLKKTVGKIRTTSRSTGFIQSKSFEALTWNATTYGMTVGADRTDRLTVRATSIDELNASEAFNIGFSSKGLINLPWELTPYSFVIDWFANIGDFLGAITPTVGLTQLGSCISYMRECDLTISHITDYGNGEFNLTVPSNGRYYTYLANYQRSIGVPLPGIVIRNNFKFDNIIRSTDALALLMLQLKGR